LDTVTEPTAVAVAIVTSARGVLVGRRNDGKPPWTFPGGKIEPGESAEQAAERETLEETGLQVRATKVIGSRVHPRTGVPITYVAAKPESLLPSMLSMSNELSEVRWVSSREASELMRDMAEVVSRHLCRTLGS
jgi:8-oxo-dGTP pyrophosphatase MutT (NUDIX family)